MKGKDSVLDLFLVSSDISNMCSVRVDGASCGSDHHVVELSITEKRTGKGPKLKRRIIDWQRYEVENRRLKYEKLTNMEEGVEKYLQGLTNLRESCVIEQARSQRWR